MYAESFDPSMVKPCTTLVDTVCALSRRGGAEAAGWVAKCFAGGGCDNHAKLENSFLHLTPPISVHHAVTSNLLTPTRRF